MRKILHIITTINRGGAENHLLGLVKGQVNKNWQIKVAFLKGTGYWQSAFEGLGVEVIPLKLIRYGDIKPIYKIRHLIQSYKPDIVHAHMPPAELYTRLALIGISHKELPMVCSKHNDEPFYKGWGHSILGRWVARRATQIITISKAVRDYTLKKRICHIPEKVITIPYGIDTNPFEDVNIASVKELRKDWSVEDDVYLIGTVARLVPQKALDTLLEGFADYLKNATKKAKLVIVGIGPLESKLKQHAVGLGIHDHVVWAGLREDIPVVMNTFDLFALTSIYEGFGLVLLEAMAAKKAIVASRVSAIPEIVEDNKTGILIPPKRPDLLAKAFQFFEKEEMRNRFGNSGWQRAKINFTLNTMIENTINVYEKCLEE